MKVLRTPQERFDHLPGFGYTPRYADVDGLRMAYVEDGPADGEPVLLLHGEPSWSFLYRKVMPVLAEAACAPSPWTWWGSAVRTSPPSRAITASRGTWSGCGRSRSTTSTWPG